MSQKGKSAKVAKSKEISIEDIYQNKNFSQPKEKTFETIYEEPKVSRDGKEHLTSIKKYKRFLLFEDYPTTTKLRKRRERAKKLAKNKKYPKRLTRARNKEPSSVDKDNLINLDDSNSSFLQSENSNILTAETEEWKMPCLSEDSEDNSNSLSVTSEDPCNSLKNENPCNNSIKIEESCSDSNGNKESCSTCQEDFTKTITEENNVVSEPLQSINDSCNVSKLECVKSVDILKEELCSDKLDVAEINDKNNSLEWSEDLILTPVVKLPRINESCSLILQDKYNGK